MTSRRSPRTWTDRGGALLSAAGLLAGCASGSGPAVVSGSASTSSASTPSASTSAAAPPTSAATTSAAATAHGTTSPAGGTPTAGTAIPGEGLTAAQTSALQAEVDAGHQPWRLDPATVASAFVAGRFGWHDARVTLADPHTAQVADPASGRKLTLSLRQPARAGQGGIWVVDSGAWLA